jgi:cysteine-rich repeat protein
MARLALARVFALLCNFGALSRNPRSVIHFRSHVLVLAVALSPAFFQTVFSCERGDTYLLQLELEVAGQDQIVGFNPNNRSYAATVNSSTAILRVKTRMITSTASYQWIVGGTTIEAGDLPPDDPNDPLDWTGTVALNVPSGQSTLRINVRSMEGSVEGYTVDVDRGVPITVAITDNVTNDISILPYTLNVLPTSPITANQPFTADLGGTVEVAEFWLDAFQIVLPGGASDAVIVDLNATVQTRGDGATGLDVSLTVDVAALVPGLTSFCTLPSDAVCTVDSDCPVPPCLQPVIIADLPTSADCAPAGLCDSLGKAQQCTDNAFCITGNLLLPLEPVLGASYMAGDGVSPGQTEALFGWADNPPPDTAVGVPPIDGDGTWNMIPAVYGAGIAGDLGIRMTGRGGGLFIALEGVMGVDSNGPDGVGVPDDASPTPDSKLVSFPVTCPFVCGDGVTDVCEECDDGNNIDGDGCEADCTLPPSSCNFAMTGSDATPQTQTVGVGCSNNVISDQSPFPWELTVSVPTPITGGDTFMADFDGEAVFSEFYLRTFLQGVVCGGVRTIEIDDFAATVQIRSGATGSDVLLGIDSSALVPGPTQFCNFPQDQTCTVNGDCLGGVCNAPIVLQDLPVLDGTPNSPGGCDSDTSNCPIPGPPPDCDCSACDALGPDEGAHCADNGFCVNGTLALPMQANSGTYTAGASGGDVRFGWADQLVPGLSICPVGPNCGVIPDGAYNLPVASFAAPTPPIGIRSFFGGLAVPNQCAMGEPGGVCASGEGCLVDADCATAPCGPFMGGNNVIMPTPDANLISCPIN